MAKHKPRKSRPTEYTTDDEDMITYDVESDELESKFAMKECFIQNPDKYIRALTPTRFRKNKELQSAEEYQDIHWCAKIKDEVEKLAYQLNEEAERTERPIRRLSKVMYGSTCADMQVDVMGSVKSSIKHVVGTTSGCFYPMSNHWEVGGRPRVTSVAAEFGIAHSIVSRLWRQFQTTGTAIRGSVVVVHEEPHPQMTGTLSYSPEETGSRQREKSLDTRHRRLDDRYRVYRGQKTARWWSVCTTPCTVCTFNACPSVKAFSGAGNTGIGETMNGDEYSLQMRADSV
ncbi:uncharacterized protein TNCV_3895441 [Trichonephila clavipes]|nr:uncharacterized protein TNCV_3895441 [Trichonephila clavipes]